jgi:hypothetical protein
MSSSDSNLESKCKKNKKHKKKIYIDIDPDLFNLKCNKSKTICDQGIKGERGDKGDKGRKGDTGDRGDKGDR